MILDFVLYDVENIQTHSEFRTGQKRVLPLQLLQTS